LPDVEEELIGQLRSDNENGVDVPVDRDEEMEAKYSLHFLKKRARANSGDSEDVKRLESLPGASLKPLKKTQ
jgi:hypothetical protein